MMPIWWQYLSGAFLVVNIVFFAVLSLVLLRVMSLMQDLKPKIDGLTTKVDSLVDKVDGIATSVKQTVDGVGSKARGVVGSAEIVAQSASRGFEKFSPIIIGVMTTMKVLKAVNSLRSHKKGR